MHVVLNEYSSVKFNFKEILLLLRTIDVSWVETLDIS